MTMKMGGGRVAAATTAPDDLRKHRDAAANSRTARPAQLLLPIRPSLRALKGEALPVDSGPIGLSAPPVEPVAAASNTGGGL
jgi:hypothetical protein